MEHHFDEKMMKWVLLDVVLQINTKLPGTLEAGFVGSSWSLAWAPVQVRSLRWNRQGWNLPLRKSLSTLFCRLTLFRRLITITKKASWMNWYIAFLFMSKGSFWFFSSLTVKSNGPISLSGSLISKLVSIYVSNPYFPDGPAIVMIATTKDMSFWSRCCHNFNNGVELAHVPTTISFLF